MLEPPSIPESSDTCAGPHSALSSEPELSGREESICRLSRALGRSWDGAEPQLPGKPRDVRDVRDERDVRDARDAERSYGRPAPPSGRGGDCSPTGMAPLVRKDSTSAYVKSYSHRVEWV